MMSEQLKQSGNASAPRYVGLIPAAGVGARMGGDVPKQYLRLGKDSILQHTVNTFRDSPAISHTYVIVSAEDAMIDAMLQPAANVTVLRCGGATRRDTVRQGLAHLEVVLKEDDWVLVHDAARPGLTKELLQKMIDQIAAHPVGGLLAMPVVDTVKRVIDGRVQTVSRDGLWLAQTPQMFRYRLLCDALDLAAQVTDESSAIESAGHIPLLIEGSARNLKVTLPSDLALIAGYMGISAAEN
ncbi:2-C-methyl-D-erythritol 4-phosphate cytidylyltransferase [Undibacterium griseum]|uniref:2-C-methyl-D-erythritol 4-phosphate cytidylyltransferase n=1 Tax=Undibacterium griseum TaxID=2762295 RepID=A0ABR6YQ88_9BURK|nr:2-C-methyl-D-erythritol 4-phosphate cytidylyltransferase [Undibacterium griseum]MBC3885943.1 2-C-methyl-D-erythritol 4-phosphate cytidylyltransferase [Undibacterium griseum]